VVSLGGGGVSAKIKGGSSGCQGEALRKRTKRMPLLRQSGVLDC